MLLWQKKKKKKKKKKKFERTRNVVETRAVGESLHSFFEFTSVSNLDKSTENMFFRKHRDKKKENNVLTLTFKMEILFARAIISWTARACSVSPSASRVLSYDHFLKSFVILPRVVIYGDATQLRPIMNFDPTLLIQQAPSIPTFTLKQCLFQHLF